MTRSDHDDGAAQLRAYVSDVMGCPADAITSISRFEHGNRHAVHRVSYDDASGGHQDVVVRLAHHGEPSDVAQAEREAAVLGCVGGVAAPALYDFRRTSTWFDTPVMCMQFLPGQSVDLKDASPRDIEDLAALVARIHEQPREPLIPSLGAPTTIASYAEDRLRSITATLRWARDPLPSGLQARLRDAADWVAESYAAFQGSESFSSGEPLSLLHGDIAPGNVFWTPEPCLIDWEYTRFGDPADEIAYTFDQNALTPPQRQAFWNGYRSGRQDRPQRDHVVTRVNWWEPVTLLGSALWWVERWVRRAELDREGRSDPAVQRRPSYYLSHVMDRVDRFETPRRPS